MRWSRSLSALLPKALVAPVITTAICVGTMLYGGNAMADSRDQAKRMHDRIAGVPPSAATLNAMQTEIDGNDPLAAALLATQEPEFYSVTLRNFAAPWTNRDSSVFVPLDDYIATIIGMVRDDLDFRGILHQDILYTATTGPAYSSSNNAHYEALESADLQAVLQRTTQSANASLPSDATAGVMTSRSAAKAFFIDGTNRAMFRFTLVNHLCNDMEQVHDVTRSPDRIRQDVARSPGGDSRVFLNNCIGCHSGMDPMAQAFAYYDYSYDPEADPDGNNGTITYNNTGTTDPTTGTQVTSKYFNNANNFEYGYQTTNDSWTNYWRNGPNKLLGWDTALGGNGSGAKSMGQELANSQAFAACQVQKVFKNVCLRDPSDSADRAQVSTMVSSFSSGYSLRQTFAEAAVYCRGS